MTGSQLDFDKDFYSVDLKRIAGELAKTNNRFSISRIGHSIQITFGELSSNSSHGRGFFIAKWTSLRVKDNYDMHTYG